MWMHYQRCVKCILHPTVCYLCKSIFSTVRKNNYLGAGCGPARQAGVPYSLSLPPILASFKRTKMSTQKSESLTTHHTMLAQLFLTFTLGWGTTLGGMSTLRKLDWWGRLACLPHRTTFIWCFLRNRHIEFCFVCWE